MFSWKAEESTLKFLKMMVAEDVTTTEEVLADLVAEEVLVSVLADEVQLQEKADLEATEVQLQEKVDLEATEIRLQEKVDLVEEAKAEAHQHQEEKDLRQEMRELLKEHHAEQKVLVTHQDQEKSKFLYLIIKSQIPV